MRKNQNKASFYFRCTTTDKFSGIPTKNQPTQNGNKIAVDSQDFIQGILRTEFILFISVI